MPAVMTAGAARHTHALLAYSATAGAYSTTTGPWHAWQIRTTWVLRMGVLLASGLPVIARPLRVTP